MGERMIEREREGERDKQEGVESGSNQLVNWKVVVWISPVYSEVGGHG